MAQFLKEGPSAGEFEHQEDVFREWISIDSSAPLDSASCWSWRTGIRAATGSTADPRLRAGPRAR